MPTSEDLSSSFIRKTAYALLSTCLLGTAVYVGYQVATEKKLLSLENQRQPKLKEEIEPVLQSLNITDDQLHEVMRDLKDEMNRGLLIDTHAIAPLFRHLASYLREFMQQENLFNKGTTYPLGFTFSFLYQQDGCASARLTSWTKGFTCDGVLNEDVVQLLQDALNEQHINARCLALVNDPVGTLMSRIYEDPLTQIGLILGTGTNACYIENQRNVRTFSGVHGVDQEMIINTEWGAFGDNHRLDHLRTEYDKEIDLSSNDPGKQIFEKMISGMYVGELVRLVVLDLVQRELLFLEHRDTYSNCKTTLYNRGGFSTNFVLMIEMDDGNKFSNARQVLENMGIHNATADDCLIGQDISQCVSIRAGPLAAAGLSTIANRMNKTPVTIAVDGSLYRYHPKFKEIMERCMQMLVKKSIKFTLVLSEDGSGKGAAIVACFAERQR